MDPSGLRTEYQYFGPSGNNCNTSIAGWPGYNAADAKAAADLAAKEAAANQSSSFFESLGTLSISQEA